MPLILWTDALIWLLVAAVAGYAWYVRGRDHLALPWRRVGSSASGMAALVVLATFVLTGLLDSLHFRPRMESAGGQNTIYSNQIVSVLDVLTGPLRSRPEKTYSAPLAIRAYAKELIELPGGKQLREFPRLRYGGTHLKDEADHVRDLCVTALTGFALSVIVWGALSFLLVLLLARRGGESMGAASRSIWRGETRVPWRAMLLAAAELLTLAFVAAALAGRYHVLGTDKVGRTCCTWC
jgi:peptide/nickel transport system permease protein